MLTARATLPPAVNGVTTAATDVDANTIIIGCGAFACHPPCVQLVLS